MTNATFNTEARKVSKRGGVMVDTKERDEEGARTLHESRITADEVGVFAGELAGAVIGSAAGPVGVVAGMVVGALVGSAAGEVLSADAKRAHRHDDELDESIGVFGGDLGAARPDAKAARVGAPSAASAGVATSAGSSPAEGPIPSDD
jgi:hypothetical protein